MNDVPKSALIRSDTRASRPGGLTISPGLWIRHYPTWPMIWTSGLVICSLLAATVHWSFTIGAVIFLLGTYMYWQRVRAHFMFGCANPAVIVATDPMLIAASTNLSMVGGFDPVVKIFRKQLPTVCGQLPRVGGRLVTVSLYVPAKDPKSTSWGDFVPRPADCATNDLPSVIALKNSIDEDNWKCLAAWLNQVPRPFRPGLFRVRVSQ